MENIVSHTEIVNASLHEVWKHLLFKIDNPQYFVPNVSDVQMLQKTTDDTIRKMTVTMPNQSMTIVEKITASPYCVKFEIMEHPMFIGYVTNVAEEIDEQSTRLTYAMNWYNKQTNESANNLDILKAAVNKSKQYIEQEKKSVK